MAGTKEIKRRIKSIKNTKKITKAMELVAASKMKRAVVSTLASRLYAEYSWDILTSITNNEEVLANSFFKEREGNKFLVILITSNRGLCGSYNTQAIKKTINLIKNQNLNFDFITVGKKGDNAIRKFGVNVIASFDDVGTDISLRSISSIAKIAIDEFNSQKYNRIMVVYTDYISALSQKANIKQLLPISRINLKEFIDNLTPENKTPNRISSFKVDYLFEGDKIKLIEDLAHKITKMQIYQMMLESNASEQSSRMLAMKNASEASSEMIDELTLVFNKARQSNITREISEISAGMASVN